MKEVTTRITTPRSAEEVYAHLGRLGGRHEK
jgi:hypothetical protein